jgi:very-short-patch-repair endonuclease
MTPDQLVRLLGGVATRRMLLGSLSRTELDAALSGGALVRIARGRYALPEVAAGLVDAARASGVVCLTSAALSYGWAVKTVPDKPYVALPKDRRLTAGLAGRLSPYWIDLAEHERVGYATSPDKTLEMCLRRLPYDDALAVADSALREGHPPESLRATADRARGPGSAQVRRVAALADGRAANPFESVLRAIASQVPGLDVQPQVKVGGDLGLAVTPDLVDVRLALVLEADSFEWHGDRAALRRDARRYDLLVANGWTVLRFAWEDVMHDQEFVRAVLEAVVARALERTERRGRVAP